MAQAESSRRSWNHPLGQAAALSRRTEEGIVAFSLRSVDFHDEPEMKYGPQRTV
jgi:hypothetical protein